MKNQDSRKIPEQQICTIKNVQMILPELSNSAVSRRICLLRDVLNKPKPKLVTMDEFIAYYGL